MACIPWGGESIPGRGKRKCKGPEATGDLARAVLWAVGREQSNQRRKRG